MVSSQAAVISNEQVNLCVWLWSFARFLSLNFMFLGLRTTTTTHLNSFPVAQFDALLSCMRIVEYIRFGVGWYVDCGPMIIEMTHYFNYSNVVECVSCSSKNDYELSFNVCLQLIHSVEKPFKFTLWMYTIDVIECVWSDVVNSSSHSLAKTTLFAMVDSFFIYFYLILFLAHFIMFCWLKLLCKLNSLLAALCFNQDANGQRINMISLCSFCIFFTCDTSFMHNEFPVREQRYSSRTSFQYDRYDIKPRSDNGFSGEPIFPSTRVNK